MSFRGSTKKPEEYSTNPNTMRARARKAKLDPYSREAEQAKSSDAKAISRAWNLAIKAQTYKDASPDERKTILEQLEKDVMQRRIRQGLDAASKIERFRKQNPSVLPPESSSASDAVQEPKDNFAQSPRMQRVGALNQPSGSASPGPPQRPLPDPNDHCIPYGVPQAVFPYQQHVPAQQHHTRDQPVQAARPSDSAVIANLQATVQRQELQIETLFRAIQHLSANMTFVKHAAHDQNAQLASVQSQLRAFHERSAQVHGVDNEFVHQTSYLRQLLDEMERAAVTASNVGTSMATGSPDQLSGHEVDNAMSEYSQSEGDGRSQVGHGFTCSTEDSPDDVSQCTDSRMEMDQVNETASGDDELVDWH